MATRRFTGKGVFEDREGNVLTLTSVTGEITLASEVGPGGAGDTGGRSSVLENDNEGKGGAGGNPSALFEDRSDAPAVVEDTEARLTAVWACYVETMTPRRTDMFPEERKLIQNALKVASVEECRQAIVGCSRSAFHMGDNERKRKYNRLSQILKGRQGKETTRERIDYFIDIFHNPTNPEAAITSEAKFKIDTLKDRVRRGNGDTDGQTAEAELWERYRIRTTWQRTERGADDVFAPVFERKLDDGDQPA